MSPHRIDVKRPSRASRPSVLCPLNLQPAAGFPTFAINLGSSSFICQLEIFFSGAIWPFGGFTHPSFASATGHPLCFRSRISHFHFLIQIFFGFQNNISNIGVSILSNDRAFYIEQKEDRTFLSAEGFIVPLSFR